VDRLEEEKNNGFKESVNMIQDRINQIDAQRGKGNSDFQLDVDLMMYKLKEKK
jgi:hypothetical protein